MLKLIVFDLDGTLAESKSSLDVDMATLLRSLLKVAQVAVISGGSWRQFETQLLSNLDDRDLLRKLSLLPTCGTQFYRYTHSWELLYSEDLGGDEKDKIVRSLHQAVELAKLPAAQSWGDLIEDRGSQITFSALGQQAPIAAKQAWDPGFVKRKKLKSVLDRLIPEFSVRLGGTTSVDITKPGIDKAYGIGKLRDTLSITISEMIFVGDALFPGGNDYPAKETGVASIQVRDPHETKRVIESILACLDCERRVTSGQGPQT
jgi:HAD superfamily hydrolase (TIGR01484 family)